MIKKLIEKLEAIAADEKQPKKIREAAKRDADGYRKALATATPAPQMEGRE